MKKGKMEMPAAVSSSSVTLSDLPENLILHILSRLPIKDAGRTGTLSRSWRRRWLSIPVFDLSGFNPNQIYHLLHLHSGCIRLFKAHQPKTLEGIGRSPAEWSHSDVCRWLSILSLRSASTLSSLSLSSPASFCWFDVSDIFRSFPNLTHLHLSGRDIHHDHQISALKDLHLDLDDTSYGVTSSIISCCPVLERLYINFEYRDTWVRRDTLDIAAPNLRWLKLSQIELPDFSVTSAPLLETVSFNCCYFNYEVVEGEEDSGLEGCILKRVFRGMASIKMLELDQQFLMFLGSGLVRDKIPVSFRNLMVVSLSVDLDYVEAVSGVLCVLRSIPDLQELNIRAYDCLDDRNEVAEAEHDLWEAHEFADLFNKLETVKLTGIADKDDEIRFIRFLLAKAHVLKTVMISFDQSVNDEESIMTELLELPKASNQAQILLTR